MNYLTKSLTKTFQSIKEHKFLFIFLTVLEIILLISSIFTIIFYQVQILANLQNIIEPIENANYNETSLQQGQPFTQEISKIYNSYNLLIKNIFYMFSVLFLIFFFLNGLIWIYTHQLLELKKIEPKHSEHKNLEYKKSEHKTPTFTEKLLNFSQLFSKYGTIYLLLIGPLLIILYFALNSITSFSINPDTFSLIGIIIGITLLISLYFLLVFSSFINIKSWKEFFKTSLQISIKKIHCILPIILIDCLITLLFLYLIYITIPLEQLFLLPLIFTFILTILFVIFRIYLIAALQELKNKDNK